MSLAKKSNEVYKMINELKTLYIRAFIDEDALKSMNPNNLELVQKSLKLVDLTNDLINEQMNAIDEINNKLDKLLEKQKD